MNGQAPRLSKVQTKARINLTPVAGTFSVILIMFPVILMTKRTAELQSSIGGRRDLHEVAYPVSDLLIDCHGFGDLDRNA